MSRQGRQGHSRSSQNPQWVPSRTWYAGWRGKAAHGEGDGWSLGDGGKDLPIRDSSGQTSGHYRGGHGYGGGGRNREAGSRDSPAREARQKEPVLEVLTGEAADKYLEKKQLEYIKLIEEFDFDKAAELSDKATAEKWAQYPPIVKNVYQEHPDVAIMTSTEADQFRLQANNTTVQQVLLPSGGEAPELKILNPITRFEYAFINYPEIRDMLITAGFPRPSAIQAQAWPLILSGHDVIGISQTGSGKTLAFILPAYVHIMAQAKQERSPGAHVLVMAPTRELVMQLHDEVMKYNCANLASVMVYGGADRRAQIRELKRGCNVIIATPGRLDDLITNGYIDITSVTFVVLDEADRMLDAGFEAVIRRTMYQIRPDRQTIMTSATWPEGVQRLANSYMNHPLQVVIGSLDLTAVTTITQSFFFLDKDDGHAKLDRLMRFVEQHSDDPFIKVLVFTTTKARATFISSELTMNNVDCFSIRGDMDQSERELAIKLIKSGETKYLVATDVASRGIDIPDLTHVINLDFPRDIEEYVHRIGRTGRAGKSGQALTFFTFHDSRHAKELIKILEKAGQAVPPELRVLLDKHIKYMERRGAARPPRRNRYGNVDNF